MAQVKQCQPADLYHSGPSMNFIAPLLPSECYIQVLCGRITYPLLTDTLTEALTQHLLGSRD